MRWGWIGWGRMGRPMVRRLQAAGHEVHVWARRPELRAQAQAEGLAWADSVAALARRCEVVCSMLGGPADVAEVFGGAEPGLQAGTLWVDMSTSAPGSAPGLAARARHRGAEFIDCPVTGGVPGAEAGALTLLAGGAPAALQRWAGGSEVFGRMVACGGPGDGYRMKLVNQTLVAGQLLGLADGMRSAAAAGIGVHAVLEALGQGSASGRMLQTYAERMHAQSGPVQFTLGLLLKDIGLALDETRACGGDTHFLIFAQARLRAACDRHGEHAGVQQLAAP